jgi:hypothetical protein
MSTRRETIILPGILRGQGHEVECAVHATKVILPGPAGVALAVAYCGYSIRDIAKKIPDGHYKLSVNAEIISMRQHEGLWFGDGMI